MELGKISIFGIFRILVLVVAASGCTSDTTNSSQSSGTPQSDIVLANTLEIIQPKIDAG